MRYVVFPSETYSDRERPDFDSFFWEHKVAIITGPTESGLYIIEGNKEDMERVKEILYPFYIMFEDFESPTVH